MSTRVTPFAVADIPAALELFLAAYRQEQFHSPLLPSPSPALCARIAGELRGSLAHAGVTIRSGEALLGYMCLGATFPFKGQRAGIIREYAHGAVGQDKERLYQAMYGALGEELVVQGSHLHLLCHLAGDHALQETLFQLGFGAVVAEELRGLADVPDPAAVSIAPEEDLSALLPLAQEHARYYRQAPIFMLKDETLEAAQADLEAHRRAGDVPLVYREDGVPCACFMVGRCQGDEEGFLLQGSNTAQIVSAYATPSARAKGIGRALLQHAVAWARERGYARLMVEHETANIVGGRFWRRHFAPYLTCSLRYVDGRL
jgi:GNAT superfamily N-acetyltransferase